MFLVVLLLLAISGHASPRDPTRPPVVAKQTERVVPARHLKLTAILVRGDHRHARINDQLLTVGDALGEYRVTEIERRHVVLESADDDVRLKLGRTGLKRRPAVAQILEKK